VRHAPNRSLKVGPGAEIALPPALKVAVRAVNDLIPQPAILDAVAAVAAAEDVASVLHRLLDAIGGALTPLACGIWLAGQEGGDAPVVVQRGVTTGAAELARLADAARRWCQAHVDAVETSLEGRDAPDTLGALLGAAGCDTLITAPLVVEARPVGLAFAGFRAGEGQARPSLALLRTITAVGSSSLERLSLAERLARQRRQSDALYRVSQAFTASLDVEHLLGLIVRLAVDTIPSAANGVLHLLDEKTGELRPRALSFVGEVCPDAPGRSQMRQGHGVAGLALERGQVINVPDVSRDSRFVRVGEVRPFASMLVAPLLLGERRIGTLSVDSPLTNAFIQEDEHLLLTLATQAAAAIENARLVRDLQQSLADLRRTQDQLIQSEKLSAIGQLIAGVAHELNNPLTAIMGYAQLLEDEEDLDEELARDLSKIHGQAERAARIVQNLLVFARQQQFRRELLDMNEVIERTVELRAYQLRVSNVQVHQSAGRRAARRAGRCQPDAAGVAEPDQQRPRCHQEHRRGGQYHHHVAPGEWDGAGAGER